MALAYCGASGTYPAVPGVALAARGLVVAGRTLWRNNDAARPLVDGSWALALTVGFAALHVWAVTRIGCFAASAALVLALPPVLGLRRLWLGLSPRCCSSVRSTRSSPYSCKKPPPPDPWHPARWSVS